MDFIAKTYQKYKGILLYLFFGACTTVLNIAVYYLFYNVWNLPNVASTIIAWVIAVAFAYITNKLFVFESKKWRLSLFFREVLSFFGCRLITGILDVVIMYLAVDVMARNSLLWKLISNVIVTVLNYFASKLYIFKKAKD